MLFSEKAKIQSGMSFYDVQKQGGNGLPGTLYQQ
jgi:hypothetical protein